MKSKKLGVFFFYNMYQFFMPAIGIFIYVFIIFIVLLNSLN